MNPEPSSGNDVDEKVFVRVHGSPALPTLIYLPGMHGDWTLVSSFRHELAGKVRFVEMCYPRTTSWSMEDYARAIEAALLAADVRSGWLIGESFGSQPAWAMVGRSERRESQLNLEGLILVGGFVKHPWPCGASFLRWLTGALPRPLLAGLLSIYATYARFRHRHAPDTLGHIAEFVRNRLHPEDPAAMRRRYTLILENDLRAIAKSTRLPIFQLAGLVDPLVPNWLITGWLRKNCPNLRGTKTILTADHNVLSTTPAKAASVVLGWVSSYRSF